jgi:hypothetical protein
MTSEYEFERYICSKETFGVAIIPNVLDDIECETMVNKIWDFLEHIRFIRIISLTNYFALFNL